MFSKGLYNGSVLKLMSIFMTSLFIFSSTVIGADGQVIINEIKKEIRDDGLTYGYQATEDFDSTAYLKKLYGNQENAQISQMLSMTEIFSGMIKDMGFNDIDGFGSSVAREGDLYDMDFFTHLKKGNENSLIWKMMGGEAAPLKTFEMLPENTVLAKTFRIDLVSLWQYLKKVAPELKIPDVPDVAAQLDQAEKMAAQAGFPIEAVTKAVSTEMCLFVTANEGKKMNFPNMPPMVQLGASLLIEKKSDFIQNLLLQALANAPTQKIKIGNFNVVLINDQLPTGTKAGFAYNDNYMLISSDIQILQKVVAAAAGKSLVNSPKFASYKSIPRNGNAAFYLSRELADNVSKAVKTMPVEMQMAASSYAVMFFQDKTPEMFCVMSKKKNGLKIDVLSTFNLPGVSSSALVVVGVVGVMAAMILPALGNARAKAKQAKSKSNLKNMGITVAVFFADGVHDKFPKDWKKFDMPPEILVHPATGTKYTLEEFFAGKADYVPLFKVGETYQGASTKPLFAEKPGLWDDGKVFVVFEDAHVDETFAETMKELMDWLKEYDSGF